MSAVAHQSPRASVRNRQHEQRFLLDAANRFAQVWIGREQLRVRREPARLAGAQRLARREWRVGAQADEPLGHLGAEPEGSDRAQLRAVQQQHEGQAHRGADDI